jgi:hypothetical protein
MTRYFPGAFIFLLLGFCPGSVQAEERVPLPSMAVVSPGVPGENKIVGTYAQPEWSARRPFPGVAVYVAPAEQYELETGFADVTTVGGRHHREWSQEFEVGLGHRLQAAVENTYANFREGVPGLRWREDSVKVTARYALADWGKLPLNPAIGVGWKFNSGAADAPLAQLVLGAELTPRLHWAADFQYEHQNGGQRQRELTAATALTYSVTNETLNVGFQAQWKRARDLTDPVAHRAEIGPCVQYRPIDQLHFDGVVLWGTERHKNIRSVFLTVGFEFGAGADDHDDDRERGGRLGR